MIRLLRCAAEPKKQYLSINSRYDGDCCDGFSVMYDSGRGKAIGFSPVDDRLLPPPSLNVTPLDVSLLLEVEVVGILLGFGEVELVGLLTTGVSVDERSFPPLVRVSFFEAFRDSVFAA